MITQHDLELFWNATPTEHDLFKYMVFQIEQCPKSGSWHAQIFMQFRRTIRMSTVQALCGGGKPHCEVSRDPTASREYCMKEETRVTPYEEYGVWDAKYHQGSRTDLTLAKQDIRAHGSYGKCLDDNALDVITARYPRWVQDQLTRVPRGIRTPPIVTIYYGPTSTGKTQRCFEASTGHHLQPLRYDNGFVNYSGQTHVLFDEFDKAPMPFGMMLQLLDKYPFQLNIKNGYQWWDVTHIFMTATEPPTEWFIGQKGYREEYYPQFARRITTLINTANEEMELDV